MKCADYLKNYDKDNNCNNAKDLTLLYELSILNVCDFANVIREKVFGKTERKLKSKTETNLNSNPTPNQTPNQTPNPTPNPQPNPRPFISILYKNGILYKTYLTNEEQLILKTAVLHNYGIVNLLNPIRLESIKNLFNKGLLVISSENDNNIIGISNGTNNEGLVKVINELSFAIRVNGTCGCIKTSNFNMRSDIEDISWFMNVEVAQFSQFTQSTSCRPRPSSFDCDEDD